VSQGKFFYVAFQNATNPDGTGGDSTIAQYTSNGNLAATIAVPGRCDGMRWNASANLMWLTVNEDANSALYTWNPRSGALKQYLFSSAKHGGGYDDLAFNNGQAFIAASNPTLNSHGVNTKPALVSVTLRGNTAVVKPVLKGNAEATDIPTLAAAELFPVALRFSRQTISRCCCVQEPCRRPLRYSRSGRSGRIWAPIRSMPEPSPASSG
jgi:hypothetical protein